MLLNMNYAPYPQVGTRGVGVDGPFDFITKPLAAVITAPVKAVTAIAHGENVVKSIAKVATSPYDALASVTSGIPILGDVTRITNVAALGPLNLATAIATGARIDHAVVANLKAQLKNVKEAAPYAQMVVSLVPGVGPGVSAAMSAGIALAEGKGIDEIAKAAIRGALPGGPLVQAGFDAALKVAAGENVGKVALEGARSQLSPAAQKAFDVGLAVMTGEKIQTALARGLANLASDQMGAILAAGQKAISSTPAFANAIKGISGAAQQGSQLAAGLLSHAGLNEKAVAAVRNQLSAEVRGGFDAVLKTQIPHIAWLANVTGGLSETQLAAGRAEAARRAATTRLSPEEQQKYINYANLQKLAQLTPEQQKQLVELATPKQAPRALDPPKKAAAPAAPPLQAPRALDPTKRAAPAPGAPAATRGAYAPYPKMGALGAPPHLPHPTHPPHGGHPMRSRSLVRDWGWSAPWSPEVITRIETCRTWGDPIEMPAAMEKAARMALGASQRRPSTVRGPDNVLYLFAYENGAMTARPCAAID